MFTLAMTAYIAGCAAVPFKKSDTQLHETPSSSIDSLLAGDGLKQEAATNVVTYAPKIKKLKKIITSKIVTNYLEPFNSLIDTSYLRCYTADAPYTDGPILDLGVATFNYYNESSKKGFNAVMTEKIDDSYGRPFAKGVLTCGLEASSGCYNRVWGFTYDVFVSADDVIKSLESAGCSIDPQKMDRYVYYQKEGSKERLVMYIPGMHRFLEDNHFYSAGRDYSELPKNTSYRDVSDLRDLMILTKDNDKITIKLAPSYQFKPELVSAINQEVADLANLFQMVSLMEEHFGVNAWNAGHQEEMKILTAAHQAFQQELKQKKDDTDQEAKEKKAREQARAELYTDFTEAFAAEIKASDSYLVLINDPRFASAFTDFPHLTDVFFNVTGIQTSVDDPKKVDTVLALVKEAAEKLPIRYHKLIQGLNVYISRTRNDLATNCDNKDAAACFDREKNTMIIYANGKERAYYPDVSHELAHVYYAQLSSTLQKKLYNLGDILLSPPGIRDDVIIGEDGLVKSWKDNTDNPRYVCVRSYGCSNAHELIATYVEDVYANNGQGIVTLLKGDQKAPTVKLLEALRESGFFGSVEDADAKIKQVYYNAGLGNRAVEQLKIQN